MANDSTQAGFLLPSTQPPYDVSLENFFQELVVGLTGLDPTLVRPRWQPTPPNMPDSTVDWAAVGVQIGQKQWNAYQKYDADQDAYIVEGTETIRVLVSFYGPNNEANQGRWEVGLQIGQNRDTLDAQKISLVGLEDPVNLPSILKGIWYQRLDSQATFSRWMTRIYPIKTLLSASGTVDNDGISSAPFSVTPTP
jgi:hypothetical protein